MATRSMANDVDNVAVLPVSTDRDASGRWTSRLYGALSGALGTIAGIVPHVLHHVGPIAGAALLTGTSGSVVFGVIGFVFTLPLLWRLKRRFGTWLAPGIALGIFAVMFTFSTLWVGPAVRDAIEGGSGDGEVPVSDPHHSAAEPRLPIEADKGSEG